MALATLWAGAVDAQLLRGRLFTVDEDGGRRGLGGVQIAVTEAQVTAETDLAGRFALSLPLAHPPGTEVTLAIDRQGWVIRQPARGRVRVAAPRSAEVIEVELVPKGSPLVWTDALRRSLIVDAALAAIRARPATAERREADFAAALAEWAGVHGFRLADVLPEIERWSGRAAEDADDLATRGLAQIGQRRYAPARSTLDRAAGSLLAEATALRSRQPGRKRELEERLIETLRLAALAAYLDGDFTAAEQRLRELLARNRRQLAPREWSRILSDLGNALAEQGLRATGEQASGKLGEASATFRVALDNLAQAEAPRLTSVIGSNLGLTLLASARRAPTEDAEQLLSEAEATFRTAVGAVLRDQQPAAWGTAQSGLGAVLQGLAGRAPGGAGLERLAEAIPVLRQAIEALPNETLPQLWAETQDRLGKALASLAQQAMGNRGPLLLREAAQAFHAALEVFTAHNLVRDWATTQTHLGNVLQELGYRVEGEVSRQAFAQALTAYRAAMEVFTREQYPDQWAATANNLGTALEALGSRTEGEAGDKLLESAAAAHRSTLEIFSRELRPRDWATSQHHLGNALLSHALRDPGTAAQRLEESLHAYRAALSVLTPETGLTPDEAPQLWPLVRADEARALVASGQAVAASEALRQVLAARPSDREILLRLVTVQHETLREPRAALATVTEWLQQFPEDSLVATRSVEFLFAAGRYQEATFLARHLCGGLAAAAPELQLVLRAYEIASLLAMEHLAPAVDAFAELRRVLADRPSDWQPQWSFAATRADLIETAELANFRAIEHLFMALGSPDRDTAAERLEPLGRGLEQGLARLQEEDDSSRPSPRGHRP
ncbi:MAG: hypothetical protein AAF657_28440 [Acidobacteriota bacterium]